MDGHIDAVRVAPTPEGGVPVVVLGVDGDDRVLPIFVGLPEATAIARGLEADDIGRPLTHDLLLDVVEELGGRVTGVEVAELADETYIADLHLATPRGSATIDARPSDSLALAARTNAPIAVDEAVFEEGARPRAEFDAFRTLLEVAGSP
ncbi:MAG: bifunctional nuclease family protein [Halobacteriales archaeon]